MDNGQIGLVKGRPHLLQEQTSEGRFSATSGRKRTFVGGSLFVLNAEAFTTEARGSVITARRSCYAVTRIFDCLVDSQ